MPSCKSVTEIFQNIDSEDEAEPINGENELEAEPQIFEKAVEAAITGQRRWFSDFSEDFKSQVFYLLYKKIKKDCDFGANYFEYYSHYSFFEVKCKKVIPYITLLIFDDNYSPTILCSVVAAALAAGSAVFAEPPNKKLLEFRNLLIEAGLPEGMFNVVSQIKNPDDIAEINKIIFIGNEADAMSLYKKHCHENFSYLCLNQTASLILESCDLQATISKILNDTWGASSDRLWSVSTIVVQESIYPKFLQLLQFKLKNFTQKNYNPGFYNKDTYQNIEKLIHKVKAAGAKIIKKEDTDRGPIFVLNYHCFDSEMCGLAINVMVSRTAKEGIRMLNNNPFFLAISLWTENYSQALEIASEAVCNYIWINCHGCISPNTPLYCANFTLGGTGGHREFERCLHKSENKNFEEKKLISHDIIKKLSAIVSAAQKSFQLWRLHKDKRSYLQEIFLALNKISMLINSKRGKVEFDDFSKIISFLNIKFHSNDTNIELSSKYDIIQRIIPVGVIALYLREIPSDETEFEEMFIEILILTLMSGNGIILFGEIDKLTWIIEIFINNLPKNLVQVVKENEAAIFFGEHPNIQDFWIFENNFSNFCCGLEKSWRSINKTFTCISGPLKRKNIVELACRKKVIWLPKADELF